MEPKMTQEELIREPPILSVLEEVEHHNLCVKYIEQFEENVSLKNENEILRQQLAFYKKMVHGQKTEKTEVVLKQTEQLSLFDEAETEATSAHPETGGFLTVGDKDAHMVVFDEAGNVVEEDELSVTLHIWPKFFGKVKYGISFRTYSTLTQVYVDSNGNYIRSENNEENLENNEALIQQYKSEIENLFEVAKQVWGNT